ncbi:outer membrane beta-barrel protein [Panacibacter ginsenosidivorans]|uniref:Outer membrane beta-barrel protein n=1 Tax=Panacibacter ginsenosidivorans TaxID=1813871 RepID=A0A5B8VB88_9BACT|nr:outer membrane beta-barrel protein [Panacibacter ginsenosidivorans]QEC67558.1 outer membrane beta-barrel protein [Panacibacter ginsenosidivorans]
MNKFLSLFAAFFLMAFTTMAQQVSGVVKDVDGKAVANATVSLHNAKDTAVIKLGVTDKDGNYKFVAINKGTYMVSASFVGYTAKYSAAFEVNGDVNVPSFALEKAAAELKGVTVVAKKPMIEVKADKTIVNVENSINAVGNDALELLRKSPGVVVDKDDNISLSGKNGVQVYIDGKPSPLSGTDLSNFLKSMQSSQIEAIELITNPSAKYEAAGNAGIINIKLKKNKSYGTNGSVNAGYNIGTYPKYNAGISLNNRNKRLNLFGNYNYNKNHNENYMNLYRIQLDTLFDQHATMTFRNNSHNFKAGADYYINSKNTVGVMVNGNLTDFTLGNDSRTDISYQPTKLADRLLIANNKTTSSRDNVNFNANFRRADTSGHELNVDADYSLYRLKSDQYQPNYTYDATGENLLQREVYNMLAPTNIDIYSAKADYEQNFKKGRLGIGGKTSYVKSDNNFDRYIVEETDKIKDRNNNFLYKENINALYVNYNRQFKGFMIQAGVRMENTNIKGASKGVSLVDGENVSFDSTFDRNYTDFFPSAAFTLNKNPMNQWSFSYSRRIDRPAYQDLNPFEFRLDKYTFQQGNTQLRPQYTNSFSVTNTFKYKLNTTLSYSHVNDVFSQIVDTADLSAAFITKKNLATQDIVNLNISMPFQYKFYSVFANINTYYSKYKADFGEGRGVNLDVFATNVYMQNTFKVAKKTTLELSGFYTSPSIWQGTFKSKAMGGVDVGVQQSVLKGKGNIKATVTDIFQTMHWAGTSDFAGQYLKTSGGWESRQFRLNFTYRFGSSQIKAARQRKTAAEDESKRVGGQGGGIGGN